MRLWMRVGSGSVVMWALMGCVGGTTLIRDSDSLAPELLTECPAELPPAQSGKVRDLMANHLDVAAQYHQCRARHSALISAVRPVPKPQRWWNKLWPISQIWQKK